MLPSGDENSPNAAIQRPDSAFDCIYGIPQDLRYEPESMRSKMDHGDDDQLKSVQPSPAPIDVYRRRLGVDDVIRINSIRFYYIPNRRPLTTPLSTKHIEDIFELPVQKAESVIDSDISGNGDAPAAQEKGTSSLLAPGDRKKSKQLKKAQKAHTAEDLQDLTELLLEDKRKSPAPIATSQTELAVPSTTLSGEKLVERDIEALLRGLCMNPKLFDAVSDEIITWTNKPAKGNGGHVFVLVIRSIFQKTMSLGSVSLEGVYYHDIFARLLHNLMSKVSSNIQEDDIVDSEGIPLAGSLLFRKLLLDQCEEAFERSWKAVDRRPHDRNKRLEAIGFIAALFKAQVVTESAMHKYIKTLLALPGRCTSTESEADNAVEGVCIIFKAVGALLDTPISRDQMDVHFSQLTEISRDERIGAIIRVVAKISEATAGLRLSRQLPSGSFPVMAQKNAILSQVADAQLVSNPFARATEELRSQHEASLKSLVAKILNGPALKARRMFNLMAVSLKGAGFDKDLANVSLAMAGIVISLFPWVSKLN
ncbi:hypothetical protein HWV62_26807 [Athelia sp. TMB]|nr:hypothetical protein HWV62_26807 [Athelia sp. TMB]